MKYVINLYGEDMDAVNTVANRLMALSTVPIVESIVDIDDYGIIVSTTKNLFSGSMCCNHNVCTTDFIDDDYVISVLIKAINCFKS